jgi:hypothetical protein
MNVLSRIIDRADRQAWLMGRMMDRLGLTVVETTRANLGIRMYSACRTCMSCRHADECEAWLSASDKTYVADAPAFCPNASFFRGVHRRSDITSASHELYLQSGEKLR